MRLSQACPPRDYDAKGQPNGENKISTNEIILNLGGESYISYADFAIAIIDELKNANFVQKTFTAVGERA